MDVCSRWLAVFFTLIISIGCQKNKVAEVFPESAEKPSSQCQETLIAGKFLVSWKNGSHSVVSAKDEAQFIETFLKPNLENVSHVEQDKLVLLEKPRSITSSSGVPDELNWGSQRIQAEAVWSLGYRGQGVIVGIVDSLVDISHPQIKPQIFINALEANGFPGQDDDGNGYIDDVYGWDFANDVPAAPVESIKDALHGTHVAGIVAANKDFGPVAGAAPGAQILSAPFMSSDSGGTISSAIEAIKYAKLRGAKIINASWGGSFCSSTLKRVMQSYDRDILFVVAAGNGDAFGNGFDLDTNPFFPVSFNLANQINVGSSNTFDFMSGFSNTSYSVVHLAAPGEGIISSVPGGYLAESGTSMAAPLVSGAAAVLWSAKPTAEVTEIRSALFAGVDILPGKNMRTSTRGRLNVKKALDSLLKKTH
jgi:subtilisin family serine protease